MRTSFESSQHTARRRGRRLRAHHAAGRGGHYVRAHHTAGRRHRHGGAGHLHRTRAGTVASPKHRVTVSRSAIIGCRATEPAGAAARSKDAASTGLISSGHTAVSRHSNRVASLTSTRSVGSLAASNTVVGCIPAKTAVAAAHSEN